MWFIVSGDLIKFNLFLWDVMDGRKRAQQELLLNMCACLCMCVCSVTLLETHFQSELLVLASPRLNFILMQTHSVQEEDKAK